MQAVDGLGLEANLVDAVDGNAFLERQNRAVGALGLVGADDVVQRHVLEVVRVPMNLVDFRLLAEAVAERPGLHGGPFPRRHRLVDHFFGGGQVTGEQMPGGDECLADVVEMAAGLIAGKPRGRIEHGHVQAEQVAHGVAIFARVQTPQHGLAGRRFVGLAIALDAAGQPGDDLAPFVGRRLPCLGRRHLAQVELIEDVLKVDQRAVAANLGREVVEPPVGLGLFAAVATDAIGIEERLDRLGECFGRRPRRGTRVVGDGPGSIANSPQTAQRVQAM